MAHDGRCIEVHYTSLDQVMTSKQRHFFGVDFAVKVTTFRACGPEPLLMFLRAGGEWTDFNPVNTWPRRQRVMMYGSNRLHIPRPIFVQVIWTELTNPFVVLPVRVWMA